MVVTLLEPSVVPVELGSVPDCVAVAVGAVVGAVDPVVVLEPDSPSVSDSKLTEGLPQAEAQVKANASKNSVRMFAAY